VGAGPRRTIAMAVKLNVLRATSVPRLMMLIKLRAC
jgi:hypothetical protein